MSKTVKYIIIALAVLLIFSCGSGSNSDNNGHNNFDSKTQAKFDFKNLSSINKMTTAADSNPPTNICPDLDIWRNPEWTPPVPTPDCGPLIGISSQIAHGCDVRSHVIGKSLSRSVVAIAFPDETSIDQSQDKVTKWKLSCTGTIVGNRWILTAAHCVANGDERNVKNPDSGGFFTVLGKFPLYVVPWDEDYNGIPKQIRDDTHLKFGKYKVAAIYIPYYFNFWGEESLSGHSYTKEDYALLELEADLPTIYKAPDGSNWFKSIPLATEQTPLFDDMKLWAAGYGVNESQVIDEKLNYRDEYLWGIDEENGIMGILGSIPTDFYGSLSAWNFIGAGDSGGPVLDYDLSSGQFSILGIHSSGACLWAGYYAPVENARFDVTFVPKYYRHITAIMNGNLVRSATRCLSSSGKCPNTAYILNSRAGVISIYANINSATGDLGRLSATAQTGYGPTAIKFHPNGKFAYILNKTSRSISMYIIDDRDGSLVPLMPSQVSAYGEPVDMAFDESGKYAYVIVGDKILTFLVENSGFLQLITTPTIPNLYQPNSILIIKNYVYVANYTNNSIAQYSIGSAGGLTPLSPALIRVTDATSIGLIKADPTNKFVYIPINTGIAVYRVSEYGSLDYVHFIYTQEYGAVVNIIFTPRSGKYLYVLMHIPNANGQIDAKILVYNTEYTDIPSVNILPAGINPFATSFDSSGKHLYLTGLADNSINIFDVDDDGDLNNNKSIKGNFNTPVQIILKE